MAGKRKPLPKTYWAGPNKLDFERLRDEREIRTDLAWQLKCMLQRWERFSANPV